jgi:hypothetical protein
MDRLKVLLNYINLLLCLTLVITLLSGERENVRQHDSILPGHDYATEIITTDNSNRFRNATRMDRATFLQLLALLKERGGLRASKFIGCFEKLMILIHILVGHSLRQTAERFQHSTETISRTLTDVMECLLRVKTELIKDPDHNVVPERINQDKYRPFSGCVGAFDGTHIPAVLPVNEQATFRNRKGFLSQNVFAACDFNGIYTYVMVGWEGCAHDGKVYSDAIDHGFFRRPGYYFLGDAGYALTVHCLVPFRGVRYHLKEWRNGPESPQNYKELYNLRHSSLRNVIERSFGIMKKRFGILTNMPSFPFIKQCNLVMCCFIIHNFIRLHQRDQPEQPEQPHLFDPPNQTGDAFEIEFDNEDHADEEEDPGPPYILRNQDADAENIRAAEVMRNNIAHQLWAQYEQELERRDELLNNIGAE